MSREKHKDTSITLRFSSERLARMDDGIEVKKLAKNRTDLVEKSVDKFLEQGTDLDVDIDQDVMRMVDEWREGNHPPSPRSQIVNWAIREFLSNLKR